MRKPKVKRMFEIEFPCGERVDFVKTKTLLKYREPYSDDEWNTVRLKTLKSILKIKPVKEQCGCCWVLNHNLLIKLYLDTFPSKSEALDFLATLKAMFDAK